MITQQSNSRLRIAYLTQLDPLDKRSWSGSLYYMGRALQQHCGDVTYLGPLRSYKPTFLTRVRAKIPFLLFRKRYSYSTSLAAVRQLGIEVEQKIDKQAFDVIVTTASGIEISYLKTNVPVVLVGDATLAQLIDYYSYFSHLSKRSIREIHTIEQKVFKKVKAVVMSSDWAAHSAIQDYQADPEHMYVVPLGANLETIPTREGIDTKKPSATCRLLFMGVEWERKGGDIAYETLLKLEEMGIEAELIICGCVPPTDTSHPRMRVIPFLDKNDEQQAREIEKLYTLADFFILPTRADCTPTSFNEANAFGLPVITTDTGGISSVICNGENGYFLPLAARGDDYANLVATLYQDQQRYLHLVQSSRAAFEERLNWDAWGRRVHDILVKECGKVDLVTTTTYSEA
jgi:glycosyltransferase involved in cell wall biosynthesis